EVPATTDAEVPATTDDETPATTDDEVPATTDDETPASTDGEVTATTDDETPVSTDGEVPATTDDETPASTDGEVPATTDDITTDTTDNESAVTDQAGAAASGEEETTIPAVAPVVTNASLKRSFALPLLNPAQQAEIVDDEAEGDAQGASMAATEPTAGEVSADNTATELTDGGEASTLSAEALSLSAAPQAQIANVGASMAQTDGGTAPLAMTDSAEPAMADAETAEADQYTGLQTLIDAALVKVTGKLTGRIKVVLAQNTTYDGDVNINAGVREVADDFELELSAEDAGEDGMNGAGASIVNGKITIKGIKVIMNSVMMAAGKLITVQNAGADAGDNSSRGGALVYNGTQNMPCEVTVEVGNNSSAEINTLGGADTITATAKAGAKSLKINAGDGFNRVTAYASGGDVDILTGSDNDTVKVSVSGTSNSVKVDTGAGGDDVTVVDNGKANEGLTVDTGAGDDTITVDVRANAGDLTVNTGLGGDTVSVMKGDHHSVENINYSQYQNQNEQFRDENNGATVSFVNGDGNAVDRFTIDVNAAGAIRKIDLSGGKGASVHLKGDLNPAFAKDPDYHPITGTANDLTLHTVPAQQSSAWLIGGNATDLALNIVSHATDTAKYNFTDALTGKRTVSVYATKTQTVNGKTQFTYDAGEVDDFTDYVFKTKVKNLDSIVFNAANKPFLSNVVLDAKETRDDDETIDVADLSAPNMNLLLKGAQINIAGNVTAQNVRAESVQGIATMGEAFGNLMHFSSNEDGSSSFDPDLKKTVEDMISMLDRAHINVKHTANITAENDIALLSRIKQSGKILSFIPDGFNVLNLKIASAAVKIDGTMTANKGSVVADALIETTIGYTPEFDDEGNVIDVAKEGAQISANVVIDDAAVIVNGKITAAQDVLLNAQSDIKAYNYGTFGTITAALPATIAATVIVNKVKTEVRGGTVTAGHSVKVKAEGDVVDETKASLGKAAKSGAINAFVAVNVVNQDVNASIGRGANVKAGGDVVVRSTAIADIKTIATSEPPKEQAPASDSFTAKAAMRIVNKMITPVMSVISSIGGAFSDGAGGLADEFMEWWSDGKDTANSVEEALAKISAGAYSVKVVEPDAENAGKGSATATIKLRKDMSFKLDAGGTIRKETETTGNQLCAIVTPEPKDGYKVAKVWYRYLEPGQDHYTYRQVEKDAQGRYIFTVDHEDIEVIVTFTEGTAPQEKPEISKDEFEDVYDLSMLFDDALSSAGDGADDEDFQMDGDVKTHANHPLEIVQPESGGKILTWLTNDDYKNLDTVYGGQKIRFIPNPTEGNKLTELKISYSFRKSGITGNAIVYTDTVTADAQGLFVYTVPEEIPSGERLTVTATFAVKEPDEPEPQRTQFGGAVAVGVVLNDSEAVIDSGATVEAGGKLDMKGTKRTVNDILADGSAIEEGLGGTAAAPAEDEPIPTVVSSFTDPDQVYKVAGAEYAVKVSSSLAGEIEGSMQKAEGANANRPVITFKPTDANVNWSKVKVVVSYYTKLDHKLFTGTRVTKEKTVDKKDLTINYDGTIEYKADLLDYTVVPGTTMEISLVFLNDADEAMTSGTQGATGYIVKNPINVSYNALTTQNNDGITTVGTVTEYENMHAAADNKYYFKVTPEKGYKLDGEVTKEGSTTKSNTDSLYATWRADGQEYKAPLKRDAGENTDVWYFDTSDTNLNLPEGVIVNIVAVFSEDKHDVVRAEKAKDAAGKALSNDQVDVSKAVSVDRTSAKAGDKVKVTVKAAGDYYPSGVTISWYGYDGPDRLRTVESRTLNVTDRDEKGNFVFTMPQLADTDAAKMTITPIYSKKNIPLKVEGSSGASDTSDKSIVLSETSGKGYTGEQITVTPSAELQKAGYKVTDLSVTYAGQVLNSYENTFTLGDYNGSASQSVQIHATLTLKTAKIETYTDPNHKGVMEGACGRADAGEKVIINI
ncbi:MAG: hypothetical protein IKN05_03955, partial [Clostridia bacterium]|nr:hypothetical protein [Clostridia bacterium]